MNKDVYAIYLKSIDSYDRIDVTREKELSDIIRANDDEQKVLLARNELVLANLRLALKIANQHYESTVVPNNIKISRMDLIEEANGALLRAAMKYDHTLSKFSSYATEAILNSLRAACKGARFIRLPEHHYKYMAMLKALDGKYETLTVDIVVKELEVTKGMAKKLLENHKTQTMNVDLEFLIEATDAELDIENTNMVSEHIEGEELRNYLMDIITNLNPMQQQIVLLRYFNIEEMSCNDIANKIGVSRQFVHSSLKKSLSMLKRKIKLDKFMEDFERKEADDDTSSEDPFKKTQRRDRKAWLKAPFGRSLLGHKEEKS